MQKLEMDIIINTDSSVPIYEQINHQIKEKIVDGDLKAGDQIPSIRALAKQLKVGVITVQRAYEDLQKEGVLETSKGKGTYISELSKQLLSSKNEHDQEIIRAEIELIAKKAIDSKFSMDHLIELVKKIYEEKIDE